MRFMHKINVIIVLKLKKIIQCPILPVSRPYPDSSRLPEHHYKNYNETPLVNEDGELRKPDDFQPRHQLRLLLEQGSISSIIRRH